jgi:hypothetical protein
MDFKAVDKYWRMIRVYNQLKRISTNNGSEISNAESGDATEDFFCQCYHLKDWLIKDKSLLKEDVEEFINKSPSLSLAADYCNSFKHAGLKRPPRSGKLIQKINTHVNFDLTTTGFVASSRLEITISGKKYDSLVLAENCIKDWDRFLRQNEITFPSP